MTRSAGKSAYQGKPHVGPSETYDAGCWFSVPKASDCGRFSKLAKPRVSRYRVFPENSVTQNLEICIYVYYRYSCLLVVRNSLATCTRSHRKAANAYDSNSCL